MTKVKDTDEFKEAVEIRKELNSVLWKDYSHMTKVFSALFGCDKSMLKRISDANYYTGGYPGENTPARISSFARNICEVALYFEHMDRLDEINHYMHDYGFEINKTTANIKYNTNFKSSKSINASIDHLKKHHDFLIKTDSKEMLKWFIERTEALQREICVKADTIKIDLFEEVERQTGISKFAFIGAVNGLANIELKQDNNKDIGPTVEKILEKSEDYEEGSELFNDILSEIK